MTLKEWRAGLEISQRRVADKLGIHQNTYARWEKDPGMIPVKYVVKINEILDIPMQEFLRFIGKEEK